MKYFIFTLMLLFCVAPAATFAASFELKEPSSARLGDIIRVPVYIDAENESVSIVLAEFEFSREMLWARSFIPAPGWLTVPGEEYNVIDNGRGNVRAAAGFEGGVSGRVLFGTLELVTVGSGIAEVSVAPDAILLNDRNENIANSNTLASRIIVTSPETLNLGDPTQLFDIRLLLSRAVFSPKEPITLEATFMSFGTIPTPVDMFFTVTDESGKIVTTSHESLVVETDAVFTKRFEDLDLPPGEYEIHMSTHYNVNVEDDFSVPFRVRRENGTYYATLGTILVAIASGVAYFFWSRCLPDRQGKVRRVHSRY